MIYEKTVDYKNTTEKRKKLASLSPDSNEKFTILEEIELLTVDIRAYVSINLSTIEPKAL